MTIFQDIPLSEQDRKYRDVFAELVVPKWLPQQAAFQRLPRYVSEYLIAKYVRPETLRDDLARVQGRIKDLLPDLERRELLKEKLLRFGEVTLIDAVEARVDLRSGQRWARIPALADDRVRVPAVLTEQQPGLLLGGMWGTAKVRYAPEIDPEAPNELVSFTPFQVGPPDLDRFRAGRAQFTADEWMCLMLQSAGYAPAAFPRRRQRLLLLSRLVPLVERNVNLVELGPRQTGKTFLLRNISPRVFTISGGIYLTGNLVATPRVNLAFLNSFLPKTGSPKVSGDMQFDIGAREIGRAHV
jgi:ATP-dependent Lon protease